MHDMTVTETIVEGQPTKARRVALVLNPAAGQRRKRLLDAALAALDDLGCRVDLHRTAGPGDATAIAGKVTGQLCDVLVAAGGDGTINEVINGMVAQEAPPPLALLPLGTANVLAYEIGQEIVPASMARTIAFGSPTPISLGRVTFMQNGESAARVFVMMAGAGFDAEVVDRVDLGLKRLIGKGAYVWSSARQLAAFDFPRVRVTIDGALHEAGSVIVLNGRSYAGRYIVAPDGKLSDGSLQVCLFERGGRLSVLRYGAALVTGRLPRLPDVRLIAGREIAIEGPADAPLQGDGDIIGRLPVTIKALPEVLRLVMPAA